MDTSNEILCKDNIVDDGFCIHSELVIGRVDVGRYTECKQATSLYDALHRHQLLYRYHTRYHSTVP